MRLITDAKSIQGHSIGPYMEININRIPEINEVVRVVQKVIVSNYAKIRYGCSKDIQKF